MTPPAASSGGNDALPLLSDQQMASFVALMKVLLHALRPWASPTEQIASPGWIGVVVVLSAASMTYGNFAALAQRNLKRMLAYSSIAHAGYMLVGVAAAGLSTNHEAAAGSVLYYLVIYAFSNLGAFAFAASSSLFFGAAVVSSDRSKRPAASAISSIAR